VVLQVTHKNNPPWGLYIKKPKKTKGEIQMTQPNNPLKRIAAFVLVLVLAAGSIPMPVLAAYDDTHNIFIAPDEYEPAEPYPSYGYEAEQIIAPPPPPPPATAQKHPQREEVDVGVDPCPHAATEKEEG